METEPSFLDAPHGPRLAYRSSAGRGPGLVWLGGFRSDRDGGKATRLHAAAEADGRAFLRFDYSGHGASSGAFEDGTISAWLEDALAAIDALTEGPQILVGSSMGGWIALLAALRRPDRVAGLLLVAPAPDFTEALMRPALPPQAREAIERDGVWMQPSDYDDAPCPITAALLEDGRRHCLLGRGGVAVDVPVRILQGMRDADVPWRHALTLAEELASEDVVLSLVKDGDHRLSRDCDLQRLEASARALAAALAE